MLKVSTGDILIAECNMNVRPGAIDELNPRSWHVWNGERLKEGDIIVAVGGCQYTQHVILALTRIGYAWVYTSELINLSSESAT